MELYAIAAVQIFDYTTRTSGNEDKVEEKEITRHDPLGVRRPSVRNIIRDLTHVMGPSPAL